MYLALTSIAFSYQEVDDSDSEEDEEKQSNLSGSVVDCSGQQM